MGKGGGGGGELELLQWHLPDPKSDEGALSFAGTLSAG